MIFIADINNNMIRIISIKILLFILSKIELVWYAMIERHSLAARVLEKLVTSPPNTCRKVIFLQFTDNF